MDLKSRLDMPTIGKRISTNINKNHSSDGGQQVIHILMYIERVRAYKKNISRRWSACENAHTFTSSTYSRNSEEVTVHRRCCEQAFNFTEHLSDRSTLPSKTTNRTSRSGAAHHTEQYQAILRPRDGENLGHWGKWGGHRYGARIPCSTRHDIATVADDPATRGYKGTARASFALALSLRVYGDATILGISFSDATILVDSGYVNPGISFSPKAWLEWLTRLEIKVWGSPSWWGNKPLHF